MIVSTIIGVLVGVSGSGVGVIIFVGAGVSLGCDVVVASGVKVANGLGGRLGELVGASNPQPVKRIVRQSELKIGQMG
jgi:hypothetical protein